MTFDLLTWASILIRSPQVARAECAHPYCIYGFWDAGCWSGLCQQRDTLVPAGDGRKDQTAHWCRRVAGCEYRRWSSKDFLERWTLALEDGGRRRCADCSSAPALVDRLQVTSSWQPWRLRCHASAARYRHSAVLRSTFGNPSASLLMIPVGQAARHASHRVQHSANCSTAPGGRNDMAALNFPRKTALLLIWSCIRAGPPVASHTTSPECAN